MSTIDIESLTKQYGAVTAVQNLDLTVNSGEVFGFLGPNGAGKSTTINMMLDFVRPTSGTVTILGHDPNQNPRAVRERMGVLPEASGFYEQDTARDHLRFAIAMSRTDDDLEQLLDRVGITHAADRPVGGFSKGMRQRLGLAIALVGSPEVLVLDEPLGGLDPSGARRLREIVREERDRGATVFFSSHIMEQVETICDRVGIMHNGNLVAADTVESLRTSSVTPTAITLSVATIPEGLLDDLMSLNDVVAAHVEDGSIVVECTAPGAKAAAVARVDNAGVPILDIDTEAPSLEDVFITLTHEPRQADETHA